MIDTEPADFHRVVAGRFTAVVDGVANWDAPSPVAEWTARDVVRHLTDWFPGFLAAGTSVTLPTGPAVDDDPAGAWRAQADSVQAVLDDPATASKILHDPNVGDVALPEAISQFYTVDVFMHTWDLARGPARTTPSTPTCAPPCWPASSRSTTCCARAVTTAPKSTSQPTLTKRRACSPSSAATPRGDRPGDRVLLGVASIEDSRASERAS